MPEAGKDKAFVIGLEGGGTHTSACLISTNSEFVAQIDDQPVSYLQMRGRVAGPAERLVVRLLRQAGLRKKNLQAVAVCLTGVGRERDRRLVLRALRRKKLAPIIIVESDAMAALVGAFGGGPGIVVIAGTGSIALARSSGGVVHRVGGWGYLIGDEGSGFAIARDGLNAALHDFDGRGPKTQLRPLFEEKFHVKRIDEIISRLYQKKPDRGEMANLAPLVFQAARDGDAVAQEIIHRAGTELGCLIVAALTNLQEKNSPVHVTLSGNLFQQKDMLWSGISAALAGASEKTKFIEPRFPPVIGAAVLALEAIHAKTDEEVLNRLEGTYKIQPPTDR